MAGVADLWKALAQAVEYPEPGLPAALDALIEACSPALPEAAAEFGRFRAEFGRLGLAGCQELYAAAFDFEADSSPYVGYHLFGEDPRRSLFMARLKERYRECRLDAGVELPDHLAAVFRLLAAAPEGEEAAELAGDCLTPALGKMRAGLQGKNTPYAGLLRAVALLIEAQANSASARGVGSCRSSSSSSSPTSR
ncbi:MAG TPA: molecular chaperone TorD family protein [Candidatus Acidoferrales bacterium]|nr:molecular chaperone TorD family protein [Candidatus Acidoferrales bacterium]